MAEGAGLAPAGEMVIAWVPVYVSSWGTLVGGSSDCLGPWRDRLQTDLNGPRGAYFGCEACSQQILGAVQSLGSSRPLAKDLFLVFWEKNMGFLFLFFSSGVASTRSCEPGDSEASRVPAASLGDSVQASCFSHRLLSNQQRPSLSLSLPSSLILSLFKSQFELGFW